MDFNNKIKPESKICLMSWIFVLKQHLAERGKNKIVGYVKTI